MSPLQTFGLKTPRVQTMDAFILIVTENEFHKFSSPRCTFVYGTPTMYVDMVNQPDLPKHDLSSLEAGNKSRTSILGLRITMSSLWPFKVFLCYVFINLIVSSAAALISQVKGFSVWFGTAGIVAGSPCPPEIIKKVISTMGIKGMTVSAITNVKIFIRLCMNQMYSTTVPAQHKAGD